MSEDVGSLWTFLAWKTSCKDLRSTFPALVEVNKLLVA